MDVVEEIQEKYFNKLGIGISINSTNSLKILEAGWPAGFGTNNEAEYYSLIFGIICAKLLGNITRNY